MSIFPKHSSTDVICTKHNFSGANGCIFCHDEYIREHTIRQVKEELLKQMLLMVHENGYPSLAVPHSTILSLESLMNINKK